MMILVTIAPVVPFGNQSGSRSAVWEVRFNQSLGEGYENVQMRFPKREQAIDYVKSKNWSYEVEAYDDGKKVKKPTKLYGDNFRYNRKIPWTH